LGSQNAKVKQSQPPNFIEASHGRALQPLGWKKDAKKTIIFNISQQERDVLVRAELKPASLNASDVRARIDQTRANWNELLSDLWYRLGDTQAPQQAIVNPPVNWERSQQVAMRRTYSGIILTVVGVLATIILASTVGIILLGLIVVGILTIINGATNARSAKKRLAQQKQATS
jgi:F0F1-type ATP synthase assembly protein I